jgi:hypothetical protein
MDDTSRLGDVPPAFPNILDFLVFPFKLKLYLDLEDS